MTMRALFGYVLFSTFSGVLGQECTAVFPRLSCGMTYETEQTCINAGCCWSGDKCFVPVVPGYSYTETSSSESVTSGVLDLVSASGLFDSDDFTQLDITVTLETNSRTHISISPVGVERWEVPEYLIPRPGGVFNKSESSFPGIMLTKTALKSSPLNIQTSRSSAGVNPALAKVIFNMTDQLVFQDQYIQFVLNTPGDAVATFGFGESTRSVQQLQVNETYTLWNTDTAAAGFNTDLYGSHPFFLQVGYIWSVAACIP
jgi:alpha-glucosidase